jgi:hypothetical protein
LNEDVAQDGEAFGFCDECVDMVCQRPIATQDRNGRLIEGSVVVSVFAIVILSVIGSLFKVR